MSKITDAEANATSLDGLVNDNGLITTLRNGPKPSWQYIVDQVYAQLGYAVVGSFVDGFTYTGIRQVGVDASGNTWIYTGGEQNLPHVVPAGTVPSAPDYFQVSVNSADNVVLDNGENLQQAIDRLNMGIDNLDADSVSTDGGGTVQDFINQANSEIDSLGDSVSILSGELSDTTSSTNLNSNQTDTRSAIDSMLSVGGNILYRYLSGSNRSMYVYIPHSGNWFQKWQLTDGVDGFDNNVPTAANGNMWIVNDVTSVIVGALDSEFGKDMTITGDVDIFGNVATINNGSIETTVNGSEIILTYVGRPDGGIANVYIDGSLETQVDTYNPATGGVSSDVIIARDIDDTSHTVKVETSGTSNPSSTGIKCRVEEVKAISKPDYENLSNVTEISRPLNGGGDIFKIPRAALELAVQNELNGSTVFSGSYHKYCYPTVPDSQKFYSDGYEVSLSNLVEGDYYASENFRLTQDLTLTNVDDPIASITMAHTFLNTGLNLKSKLTWTEVVSVTRFYQSMWALKGESVLFGGENKKINATGSGSSTSLGVYNTYNAAVWNNTDEWVSYLSANMPANSQQKTGSYIGMYMWDRPSDSKVYMRGPNGTTVIGDSFNTDTSFRIGMVPNPDKFLDYDAM